MKHIKLLLTSLLALCVSAATAGTSQKPEFHKNPMKETSAAFFKTAEAQRIGDQILVYQRVTGGWPKNIDMARPMNETELAQVMVEKNNEDDSTTDNGATNMQMAYLARLYQATKQKKYKEAFCRGVEYLLSGQYENGGWPQFWPKMQGYQIHITFNDDAMINTMTLLRDVYLQKEPYGNKLTTKAMRQKAKEAFDKGVECILKCQIITGGEPTVWCQQHDRETFKPAPARAYELPSYCSQESAAIVGLLMDIPNPSDAVKKSIEGAMKWFDKYKLTGLRVVYKGWKGSPDNDRLLVKDPTAGPIWGRFYDLDNCEPYACDRDGIPRRRLDQIGVERRTGYGWYGDRPAALYAKYREWARTNNIAHPLELHPEAKGINENGTFDMFGTPRPNPQYFDAVVSAGESIQEAIEKAPDAPAVPYKILLRKGTYNQKVIIDKPNIVLVGEDRDSTIIVYAETAETQTIKEYKGQPVHQGVVVLQDNANDCLISGLTVYNNYGTTVEKTTRHQMAVFGRATRTIVINCNIFADGNDALSLWCQQGGMYYHADLYLRCPGVDFICPRGRCYATRCRLVGDSRAILWHDGRGDIDNKFVITNSTFDALSPTVLGRYHHDHQFYVVNCKMSDKILDSNISYAYTDKVLDPCPWGQRAYYYGCTREGGHSGWLNDNLEQAKGQPKFYEITAKWTFEGKWNPEAVVRSLWKVVRY